MKTQQSILFDKTIWNEETARKWLKEYRFKYKGKMHETNDYLRFRQFPPDKFKQYRTFEIGDGILFIIEI